MNLSQMLARNAGQSGAAVALTEINPAGTPRREITWTEFDISANRLSNALLSGGIRKGDRVLHLMRNSIDWLVAYFGIIRTGAWAVPLNFRFSGREIKYCADIAQAKIMVLDHNFGEVVSRIRPELDSVKEYIFAGGDIPDGMTSFRGLLEAASPGPLSVTLNGDDGCGL